MMPSPDSPLVRLDRPLERIGRYRILERIGKGAMGVVFAARDDLMDRSVALKILAADLDGEPDIRARFFREAQVAARLVHPNVVTIFDIGEEDGRLYMVMELLRGHTLGDYLRDRPGPIDFEWKADVILQVCDGLGVAAAAGVSHRDIKPGNLFVQTDGSVKILDFGIARLASSSMTASGFIVGTPDYMSPEQARGIAVDPRSDQFSVAAVMYYLLSGRKPFAAPSLPAVLHKVVSEDPAPLTAEEAPFGLSRIVMRALAKKPDARYPTIGDMAAEIRKVMRRAEGETQALAMAACQKHRQLLEQLKEDAGIRSSLGLPASDGRFDPVTRFERVPEFFGFGSDTLRGANLRFAAVREAADVIDRTLAELEPALLQLRSRLKGLETSRAMLEAGDVRTALTTAEQAFLGVPESTVLADHVARCRSLVSEQQALDDRVAAIATQAAVEHAAGRLAIALELTSEGLALLPQDAALTALAAQISGDIAREAGEKRERLEQFLTQARRALAKERFDEADEACRRARELDAESRTLAQVAAQVASARAAHEVAQYRQRVVAERLGQARDAFEAGRQAEAIGSIEALLVEHPGATAVTQELARMRSEVERKRVLEAAQRTADELVEDAEAAWAAGDAAATVRLAERAIAAVAAEPRAVRLLGLARARLLEIAEREARAAQAADHLDRARTHLARGRLDKALREARQAIELDAALVEGPPLVAEILKKQQAEALHKQMLADAAQRAKQIRPLFAEAQAALRDGSFARATELTNHALTIDPGNPQLLEFLNTVKAEMALAPVSEDTVELVARDVDPDDTQVLPAVSSVSTVALVLGAAARTRRRAADWIARMRLTVTPRGPRR